MNTAVNSETWTGAGSSTPRIGKAGQRLQRTLTTIASITRSDAEAEGAFDEARRQSRDDGRECHAAMLQEIASIVQPGKFGK
jgi:hypothetical protein